MPGIGPPETLQHGKERGCVLGAEGLEHPAHDILAAEGDDEIGTG